MRIITKKVLLALGALAISAVATPAAAQEPDRAELERQARELRDELRDIERQLNRVRSDVRFFGPNVITFSTNRTRLGVLVRTSADDATDAIGAVLESVTSGGPADEAGLEEGDIVISFDGEVLTGRYPPAGVDESEPAIKLIDLVRDHEPGDEVTMEYRRGNATQSTVVTLDGGGSWTGFRAFEQFGFPGGRDFVGPRLLPGGGDVRLRLDEAPFGRHIEISLLGDAWSDIELVRLNEDLGRYFGTNEGLLVITPPDDESIGLQSGDVIVSIDGRDPRTPSRALRILRSYESGETVNFEIMRDRNRSTVSFEVPERDNDFRFNGRDGAVRYERWDGRRRRQY